MFFRFYIEVISYIQGFDFLCFLTSLSIMSWMSRFIYTVANDTITREMQIKSMIRYHLTTLRTIIIKRTRNYKYWRGCEVKRTLVHCWWKCKLVQRIEKQYEVPQKLIELPYVPAVPLLSIYMKEVKSVFQRHICSLQHYSQ